MAGRPVSPPAPSPAAGGGRKPPPGVDLEPLYTIDQVAEYLAVTPRYVRDLRYRGELRSVSIGRLVRFPRSAVVEYLEASE